MGCRTTLIFAGRVPASLRLFQKVARIWTRYPLNSHDPPSNVIRIFSRVSRDPLVIGRPRGVAIRGPVSAARPCWTPGMPARLTDLHISFSKALPIEFR